MPVQMNANQAADFLKQVAAQSYGSGCFEGVKGGEGSIGMIGGKPVKFNTHWKERRAETTPEMIKSSNELRVTLLKAAMVLADKKSIHQDVQDECFREICKELGLGMDNSVRSCKDLLSRKVVAKVLGMIDFMLNDNVDAKEHSEELCDSFAGVSAKSSKGVDTSFAVREREAFVTRLAESVTGLGIPTDKKTLEDLARSMQSPRQDFSRENCAERNLDLLEALKTGVFRSRDTSVKDTVEFLARLPLDKRADGLAAALAMGPDEMAALKSERIINDLRTLQNKGPITSETVKLWTDQKISQFKVRYPYAPELSYGGGGPTDYDLTKGRITTARTLDLLMLVDDLERADLLKTNNSQTSIDLAAWKEGPRPEIAMETVLARASDHKVMGTLGCLAPSYDEVRLILDWGQGPEDITLSKAAIPVGAQPMNPAFLEESIQTRLIEDLPRTQIKATFVSNNGKEIKLDTGNKVDRAAAQDMAGEIRRSVNTFLGLPENAPETKQTRMVLGMFSQFGMGPTQSIVGEHVKRNMTITREGGDVLVRATNLNENDDNGSFDFTVRIRPDGSNSYESVSVMAGSRHKNLSPADHAALCLVRAWGNLPLNDRKRIYQSIGKTFPEQLKTAKELVEKSPAFQKVCNLKAPSAEQLEAFSKKHKDGCADKMKSNLSLVNHTGLAQDFIRCFNGKHADMVSVQGEFIANDAPIKDENCLKLGPGESWRGHDPTQYKANKAALEKMMSLIPPDNPNRKALMFLMTLNMGLEGPVSGISVHSEMLGLPGTNELVDGKANSITVININAESAPHQDLSVDGNDLVLTQRFAYMPAKLMIDSLSGKLCYFTDIMNNSMPSMTFVAEIRAPMNQNLKDGEVPQFTCTTRVLEG